MITDGKCNGIFTMSEAGDEKTIRVISFSGKKSEWPIWEEKFLAAPTLHSRRRPSLTYVRFYLAIVNDVK